jgi:hypothetical protein
MKRGMGLQQARQIYTDFEDALSWNLHFWLHRGALELETDSLDLAENFLRQAKSLGPSDVFVDNELAYLAFKKAIAHPSGEESALLVDDAIKTLDDVATRREDQMAHAYHIMGRQGLIWTRVGESDRTKKRELIEFLLKRVRRAGEAHSNDMIRDLQNDLQRELLSLAIPSQQ